MSRFEGKIASSAAALAVLALLAACGDKAATPAAAQGGATPAAPAAMPGADAAQAAGADPHAAGMPPMGGANPHAAGNPADAAAVTDFSGIKKAEGGQTVAELFEHKQHLAGQAVAVRGKVVKVNANIMGRTWVHLRDGTGAEGKNDVTVTTAGPAPAIGATALVSGKLATDKDLGMGYKYEIIVEDATIKTE